MPGSLLRRGAPGRIPLAVMPGPQALPIRDDSRQQAEEHDQQREAQAIALGQRGRGHPPESEGQSRYEDSGGYR